MTTQTATTRPTARARATDWTLGPAKWLAAGLLGGAGLVGLAWVMTTRAPAPLMAHAATPVVITPETHTAAATPPISDAAQPTSQSTAPPTDRPGSPPTEAPDKPPARAHPERALTAAPEAAPSTLTRFVEQPAPTPAADDGTPSEPSEPEPRPAPASIAVRINVNTADSAQLDLLPGIGPVIAERIIEERRANGPYRTLRDLERVRGIGPKTAAKLAEHVRFE